MICQLNYPQSRRPIGRLRFVGVSNGVAGCCGPFCRRGAHQQGVSVSIRQLQAGETHLRPL